MGKILVTGGTGLVGSRFIGDDLSCLIRFRLEVEFFL